MLRACAMALLIGIVGLAGCSQSELVQKFASTDDQTRARGYIDLLRRHQFVEIEKAMDASLAGPDMPQTLEAMARVFPPGEPRSVKLGGAQSVHMPDASTVNLTFEYEFPEQWLLANVAVADRQGSATIVGFHVHPQANSLQALNRFTLRGKSPMQYSVLMLTVLVPLFTLWALVSCARTKLQGRKWPWILFILLGIGKFSVNWTTGASMLSPLWVQVLGASAVAAPYGPWVLSVSVPLGAAVFLLVRSRLRASTAGIF